MDLELSLELDRSEYLQGESITARVALSNRGGGAVELPDPVLSDRILGYALFSSGGAGSELKPLGTYHHQDLQRRLQAQGELPDRVSMVTLQPGEARRSGRDLLLLSGPLAPGGYSLRVVYRWGDVDLQSEPAAFEVLPSKPQREALGWDAREGVPYHMLLAWVDTWKGRPLLMEAATFGGDPSVLRDGHRLDDVRWDGAPEQLSVARGRGPQADMRSMVVWRSGGTLGWRALGMDAPAGVGTTSVELPGCRLVPSVYCDEGGVVVCVSDGSGGKVRALRLAGDGGVHELGAHDGSSAVAQTFLYTPELGPLYGAVTQTADGWRVKTVELGKRGGERTLLDSRFAVGAFAGCVGVDGQPFLAVALVRPIEKSEHDEITVRLFSGSDPGPGSDGPRYELPHNARLQLALGAQGEVHLLAEVRGGGILHGAPDGSVESATLLDQWKLPLPWAVGFQGQLFVLGSRPGKGVVLTPPNPMAPPGAGQSRP